MPSLEESFQGETFIEDNNDNRARFIKSDDMQNRRSFTQLLSTGKSPPDSVRVNRPVTEKVGGDGASILSTVVD